MEVKKKIAVVGASYLQLPLVQKCIELGHEVYCFAHEEGAVCRDFCDRFFPVSILQKEEILNICTEIGIDGVLTIASDIAIPTVNYIAAVMGLTGNSPDFSIISTNKNQMKNALRSFGLNVAKFCAISNVEDLDKVEAFRYPLIVKPADRSGSLGVTKISGKSELEEAFFTALSYSINQEVIVEEFIQGYEISVESITFHKAHYFLSITDKVTSGAPHFVELEHHQPSIMSVSLQEEILSVLPQALNALGIINGAAHSEFIITDKEEVFINEIGARMGGDFIGSHLVRLSTGYDFLKGVIDVALGDFKPPILLEKKRSGVVFLSCENDDLLSVNPEDPSIVEFKIISEKKDKLTKSADRHGYAIYQSDKKINFVK